MTGRDLVKHECIRLSATLETETASAGDNQVMPSFKSALPTLKRPFVSKVMPGFDADYYLAQNADVRSAGVDPLRHFMRHGWKEGRNPSRGFSVSEYLEANPDVKKAGVNPLSHYLEFGICEGRALSVRAGAAPIKPGVTVAKGAVTMHNDPPPTTVNERIIDFHRAVSSKRGVLI